MSPLDVLAGGLFDYAGTFPPASLSLEAALAESAGFPAALRKPHLAAADLVAALPLLEAMTDAAFEAAGFQKGRTLVFCCLGSVLARGGPHVREAERIKRYNAARAAEPRPKRVASYEVRLAPAVQADPAGVEGLLGETLRALGGARVLVCLEPDLSGPDWERSLEAAARALEAASKGKPAPPAGLKVRGSGASAATPARLARVLERVIPSGLPFKATAGLHHPIVEKERYGNALGFLNLAAAVLLLRGLGAGRFPAPRLLECLQTERADAFDFGAGLRWQETGLGEIELVVAKQAAPFSVGSCSLREPDDDLARLFPGA